MTGRFVPSLLFAAFAGLGAVPWLAVAGPVLGPWAAALYSLGAAVLYAGIAAPGLRPAVTAAGLAALLGLGAGLLSPSPTALVAGAALALAVARAVVLGAGSPLRRLALEVILVGGGLLFARLLFAPSALAAGLAIWGFFLVQSLGCLAGGGVAPKEAPRGDAFEEARRQALEVLEGS